MILVLLEIIKSALALASAVIGLVGNTWDPSAKGVKKITPTGWIVVCLASSFALLEVAVTIIEHREDTIAELREDELRRVTNGEIHQLKTYVASLQGELIKAISGSPLTDTYTVEVITGDDDGAGTDAKVYLKIWGTVSGQEKATEEYRLDSVGNNFTAKSVNSFQVVTPHLDQLTRIQIRHDNSRGGPEWQIASILLRDTRTGKVFRMTGPAFWLARTKGEKAIKATRKLADASARP